MKARGLLPGKDIKIIVLKDVPQCMLEVQQGKVDLTVGDGVVLDQMVRTGKFSGTVSRTNFDLRPEPWGIAVGKGQNELVARINEFIDYILKDGENGKLAQWMKIYLGNDFDPKYLPSQK
jgi:ABC-type amino acid transport substrate-binding protein